ncbi:hypothetical protein BO221_50445 [Archangium sp. Cb G35]|uniref:helix-turn-helix domain-containing protein n=1 Tax=Archangium sp. Cb G35 TaxID=1920190 RepID=UPI000936A388|nr:helix-turn-helix domain-containing protein [Archangium sp. Cb G35]OJT16422.1 hypothetical protein BO221_50445 [Archangium sp. Cb G35]
MDENDKKDGSATSQGSAADNPPATSSPAGEKPKRVLRGAMCAPPPPPPPEYLRQPPPMLPARPDGWVCRDCCAFWNWKYRPPSEPELDDLCGRCDQPLSAEERKVEVQRLTLAFLAGRAPTVTTMPVPTVPGRQQRKASSGLLSKKEAARRLGVDRATTLAQFIASGRIKTVDVNGHQRIPVSEIERILSDGLPATESQPSRARRAPKVATSRPSESPADAIRKLKF